MAEKKTHDIKVYDTDERTLDRLIAVLEKKNKKISKPKDSNKGEK